MLFAVVQDGPRCPVVPVFGYSRKMDWALSKIRFEYAGGRYDGRGLLSWNPTRGFHVEAFLSRHGTPLPHKLEFGKVGFAQPNQVRAIRMGLGDGTWACSGPIRINDHLETVNDPPRLCASFPSVLFIRPNAPRAIDSKHYGSAVLDIGKGLVFPEVLTKETRVGDSTLGCQMSASGLNYEADGVGLRAFVEPGGHLKATWRLTAPDWTAADAWGWGQALADSLSFLGGRTVKLLERTTHRRGREYSERRRCGKVQRLGLLSMAPRETHAPVRIDKQQLIAMTRFFLKGGKEADVARRMCTQMALACRQPVPAAQELLCANILDAALRTLLNLPYKKCKKIERLMSKFRDHYLSDTRWDDACEQALAAYRRLRHRNAHPDWLIDQGGALSRQTLETRFDDLIRLAWFYGYMILALAGLQDLEPKFPASHKNWNPVLTVASGPVGS